MRVHARKDNERCLFGYQMHSWGMALTAALNQNYGSELPADPSRVYFCAKCGAWEPLDGDE